MKNTLIATLILCACVNFAQAQLNPNNLFLVFDNKDGIIKTEREDIKNERSDFQRTTHHYKYHQEIKEFDRKTKRKSTSFSYQYRNKEIWGVTLSHLNAEESKHNNYILLLPKQMFDLYKETDRVKNISEMETIWETLTQNSFSMFFRNYQYFFQMPLFDGRSFRSNVFMVFSSDLNKDYIPCYELNVYTMDIEAHNDVVEDNDNF
ncbi:hypothetical protein [Capnocytophaga canis]|uniref:hypothetical protein n=1 Tax=Capnocytophaga canis TaxID=1848903 RepID=UPI001562AB43|nr:hypothetical protein [Capnocytophaga canis]